MKHVDREYQHSESTNYFHYCDITAVFLAQNILQGLCSRTISIDMLTIALYHICSLKLNGKYY